MKESTALNGLSEKKSLKEIFTRLNFSQSIFEKGKLTEIETIKCSSRFVELRSNYSKCGGFEQTVGNMRFSFEYLKSHKTFHVLLHTSITWTVAVIVFSVHNHLSA